MMTTEDIDPAKKVLCNKPGGNADIQEVNEIGGGATS